MIIFLVMLMFCATTKSLELSIGAQKHAKMPLIIGLIGEKPNELLDLARLVAKDLDFSRQFKTEVVKLHDWSLSKHTLQSLAQKNAPLALFINLLDLQKGEKNQSKKLLRFEWRLYDLLDLKMVAGKTVTCIGDLEQAAHTVSNHVWRYLMGEEGGFDSTIVACKKIKNGTRARQYIYAMHFANSDTKKMLIDAHTVSLAPRWHPQRRLLYYSQHTPSNVRLMSIDSQNRKRVVTNFDGLNLTPAISPQGQIVVALSSGGCEKLYRYDHDSMHNLNKFIALTDCRMHAISPSFIDEDHLVFCAIEGEKKLPRIAILNLKKRTAKFLTGKSFCVSPAYSAKKEQIVYCKKISGWQQLFVYDMKTEKHTQLTTSNGDKDECSWSPCGKYILFTEYLRQASRIAIFSLIDNSVTYLTPIDEVWSFPAWSPCYEDGLFVNC